MNNENPAGENPAANITQPETAAPAQGAPAVEPKPVAPVAPAAPAPKKGFPVWAIILIIVGVLAIAGTAIAFAVIPAIANLGKGGNGTGTGSSSVDTPTKEISKGKCKFYECLSKVTDESTVAEVTEIFGFEPEKTSSETATTIVYTWTFDENHTINLNASSVGGKEKTISLKLDKYVSSEIEKNGVTFENVQTIKSNLNKDGGVSYEQFKDYMGGVDGTLIEVGSWNKYEWRSTSSKGYMTGSFSRDGQCMFMSGMTY